MAGLKSLKEKYLKYRASRQEFLANTSFLSPEFQIATWFGTGLMIPAPGTWGTLGGALFGIFLLMTMPAFNIIIIATLLLAIGYWATREVEKQTKAHDSSFIVIDEVVAILYVFALLPQASIFFIITGFVIFRVFDAIKPWPINLMDQKISGAAGVMLDDLMAGVYTLIVLWIFAFKAGWA